TRDRRFWRPLLSLAELHSYITSLYYHKSLKILSCLFFLKNVPAIFFGYTESSLSTNILPDSPENAISILGNVWIKTKIYGKIIRLSNQISGKSNIMAEKKLTDLKEFIENINKKNKDHNGKAIRFAFV